LNTRAKDLSEVLQASASVAASPVPGWPVFTREEAEAVSTVLLGNRVNYWTGEEGREFEREYAAYFGSAHGVAMANGTVVLDAALAVGGIGPGDEVIVPPRTYIASVSTVVRAGATPVFVDVDRDSQNMTPETIERALTSRTRAILCVHLAGWPCEMTEIMEIARQHGLFVIEDCAQSHGARLHGRFAGTFGHVAGWSFCQDKIMSTGGEGGMVTTDSESLWRAMWSMKDHGKSWEAVYERDHPPGFRWLHESFGTNWRMTEMQAAIGRIQLRRLPDWSAARRRHAERLWAVCSPLSGLRVPVIPDHVEHAAYKCYVFVEPKALRASWSRDRIMNELVALGVPAYSGSCSEVYLERAFDGTPFRPNTPLPVARELGETSLMFLVHPSLGDEHIEYAAETIERVLSAAVL